MRVFARYICICLVLGLLAVLTGVKAQVVRQFTDITNDGFRGSSLDDTGTTVVMSLMADPFGVNPTHRGQVVVWTLADGSGSPVTTFPLGISGSPSVTDDGLQIAFVSLEDPVGQNPNGSLELFLIGSDGSGLVQLTDDATNGAGSVSSPYISGSGNRILFSGTIDPGGNPDQRWQLFVIDTATSTISQVTQFGPDDQNFGYSISDDGERVVFSSNGDPVGSNADGTFEIFRVDADGSNPMQLTSSPTDDARLPVISVP